MSELSRLLTARGFDALTATEAGTLGQTDEEQLRFANRAGRIIITHNRVDFERLAVEWSRTQESHAGIVLAVRRADVYDLARHVLPVLLRFDQLGWQDLVMFA